MITIVSVQQRFKFNNRGRINDINWGSEFRSLISYFITKNLDLVCEFT